MAISWNLVEFFLFEISSTAVHCNLSPEKNLHPHSLKCMCCPHQFITQWMCVALTLAMC